MDAMLKWMASPEVQKKKKAAAPQDRAWDKFAQQFPNADRSKFVANVEFAKNHPASAKISF